MGRSPSLYTEHDIAEFLLAAEGDLRTTTWRRRFADYITTDILQWLDYIGVSEYKRGKTRSLTMPLEEALAVIHAHRYVRSHKAKRDWQGTRQRARRGYAPHELLFFAVIRSAVAEKDERWIINDLPIYMDAMGYRSWIIVDECLRRIHA